MLPFAIFEGLPEAKSERLVSTEWLSVGVLSKYAKNQKIQQMALPSRRNAHFCDRAFRLDETLTFVLFRSRRIAKAATPPQR